MCKRDWQLDVGRDSRQSEHGREARRARRQPERGPNRYDRTDLARLKIEERVVVQVARAQGYAALGYALRTTATTLTAGNNPWLLATTLRPTTPTARAKGE